MRTNGKTVALVLTNHGELGETGRQTGAFLPEVAHPHRLLTEAGYRVEFVSPAGGAVPFDPKSLEDMDAVSREFHEDPHIAARLQRTAGPTEIAPADLCGVFFAGGHGAMWDFPGDTFLARFAAAVHGHGGVLAAVCHGPAGLVDVRLPDGSPLVANRWVAAFTAAEERAVGLERTVPFLLDEKLAERGAQHSAADPFQPHVVTDGRLVTGQNPASSRGVTEAMLRVLREVQAA